MINTNYIYFKRRSDFSSSIYHNNLKDCYAVNQPYKSRNSSTTKQRLRIESFNLNALRHFMSYISNNTFNNYKLKCEVSFYQMQYHNKIFQV